MAVAESNLAANSLLTKWMEGGSPLPSREAATRVEGKMTQLRELLQSQRFIRKC